MKLHLKFWQKAFLCLIVCFLIGFDVTAYMIVQKSYDMSKANEIATADSEYSIIKKSVSQRILSISKYYTNLNVNNIQQYIAPYAQYYVNQNIYIALYQNNVPVYTSFPGDLSKLSDIQFAPGEKYIQFRNIEDQPYLLLASHLDVPETDLVFMYIKSEENLVKYRQDIADYAIKTGTAVSIALAVILIFMLLKLTRPIRMLNKTAKEIAKGNYKERAVIKSHDEIGEFSGVFNSMVENIEMHIEELSQITDQKQRFIDNLSHEMRTPVAAVLGYGELLKNAHIQPEERLSAIDYIITQSLRLQNLSAKLMELSSMKKDLIEMKPVHLSDIVERAQNTLRKICEEKSIDFEVDMKVDDIMGDPDLLESLFQNFFENAIRVLDQKGKIRVYSEYEDNRTCVTIEDNGPGMPPQELKKIFEPFYRIDKARTRRHGGAGLGLSICRQICDLHNAKLMIFSEPKIGTQIKIYFTT